MKSDPRAAPRSASLLLLVALASCSSSKNGHTPDLSAIGPAGPTGDAGSITSVITAPASGSTVTSTALVVSNAEVQTTHVTATLTDPVAVTEAWLYVDGASIPTHSWQLTPGEPSTPLDYYLDLTPGAHSVVVEASDDAGQVASSAPVMLTVTDGIKMTAPQDLDSVTSPVTLSGTAYALPGHNIVGMHVYVDDNDEWQTGATTGNTYAFTSTAINLAVGVHDVVVQSWDDESPQRITRARLRIDVSGDRVDAGDTGDTPGNDPYVVAAGDIAGSGDTQALVGALIKNYYSDAKYVITFGDNAYGSANDIRPTCPKGVLGWAQGTMDAYMRYFDPSWGPFKTKMLPSPGNHDYGNFDSNTETNCDGQARVMEGYYAYFTGANPASPTKAVTIGGTTWDTFHYGYDILTASGAKYRYIAINSGDCFYPPYDTQNCGVGSSEFAWLSTELQTHKKTMLGGPYAGVIVSTHFDRWQSGGCAGGSGNVVSFLKLMQGTIAGPNPGDVATNYHVDLFLNGHVHNYERFCQLSASTAMITRGACGPTQGPVCDPTGPMEINVGTGGADNGSAVFNDVWPASQVRVNAVGVLKLTLHDASIDFDFRDSTNASRDFGNVKLHGVDGTP